MDINFDFSIDSLKVFYVVGKTKNITKASTMLLVSQPAVSRTLKNMEKQLECQLLVRSKKGVELTKEGQLLFESSKKILESLNTTLSKILKTKEINILVGKVLAENVLTPYINLFRKKYPNISINLRSTDINGVLAEIKSGESDFAIGYPIECITDEYEQRKIFKELHPILVCNSSYKDLINRTVKVSELKNYPIIISAKGSTTYNFALNFFKENNLNIKPSMEILGTSLIENLVEKGMGISFLTEEFIQEKLKNKKLYKVKKKKKIPTRELCILTSKERKYTKEILYFVDLLIKSNLE